jgi:hypothetical protein
VIARNFSSIWPDYAFENENELTAMRCEARSEYERKFTAEKSYHQMMIEIYENAIASEAARRHAVA